jgi:hypothetical protein
MLPLSASGFCFHFLEVKILCPKWNLLSDRPLPVTDVGGVNAGP